VEWCPNKFMSLLAIACDSEVFYRESGGGG